MAFGSPAPSLNNGFAIVIEQFNTYISVSFFSIFGHIMPFLTSYLFSKHTSAYPVFFCMSILTGSILRYRFWLHGKEVLKISKSSGSIIAQWVCNCRILRHLHGLWIVGLRLHHCRMGLLLPNPPPCSISFHCCCQ